MANAISGWKQISQSVLENLQSICISGFQRKSMMLTFGGFEDGCCKEEKHIRNSYLFLSVFSVMLQPVTRRWHAIFCIRLDTMW